MSVEEFVAKLQDYFGGRYTKTQAEEVTRWAQKNTSEKIRFWVYRYAVDNLDTQYKTPPAVKKLKTIKAEIAEAYPEISASSERKFDNLQIEESAGYDPGNLWQKVFEKAAERKGVSVAELEKGMKGEP